MENSTLVNQMCSKKHTKKYNYKEITMNILIACEESQAVCKAFRELGGVASLVTFKNVAVENPSGTLKVMC